VRRLFSSDSPQQGLSRLYEGVELQILGPDFPCPDFLFPPPFVFVTLPAPSSMLPPSPFCFFFSQALGAGRYTPSGQSKLFNVRVPPNLIFLPHLPSCACRAAGVEDNILRQILFPQICRTSPPLPAPYRQFLRPIFFIHVSESIPPSVSV